MRAHSIFGDDSSAFDSRPSDAPSDPLSQRASFDRQIMLLEDEERTLRKKIRALEFDMEEIDASIRTVMESVDRGEDMGLEPEEVDEIQWLRTSIRTHFDEQMEAARRSLRDIERGRDDLFEQRRRSLMQA